MPHRLVQLLPILLLLVACAAPVQRQVTRGLEPPVASPPASLDAAGRLDWWQNQLPRLGPSDHAEARLLMGELNLELRQAAEARQAFYEVLGAKVSASEMARAERGIGLTYLLDDRVGLAVPHLEKALGDLDLRAQGEVRYLIAASQGRAVSADLLAYAPQADVWLPANHGQIQVASAPKAPNAPVQVDMTRAEWRAAPMKSNWDPMVTPYRITVHHTAEPFEGTSRAQTVSQMQFIQRLHQNDNGWADVGYHYLIDREGRLIEGRPIDRQGAHADGKNNIGNIGICVIGNFVGQPERPAEYHAAQVPTQKQMATLERTVKELRESYDIPRKHVYHHNKFTGTLCPGPTLISWVRNYSGNRWN